MDSPHLVYVVVFVVSYQNPFVGTLVCIVLHLNGNNFTILCDAVIVIGSCPLPRTVIHRLPIFP